MVESLRELTVPQLKTLLGKAQAALRATPRHIRTARKHLDDCVRAQEVFDTRVGQILVGLAEREKGAMRNS